MILVDTSVWIDFLNQNDTAQNRGFHCLIEQEVEIFLTGIIYTEILQGISSDSAVRKVKKHLKRFTVLEPRDLSTYDYSACIYRKCRKKGITIRSIVDCINAAIAIENDLSILQRDRDYVHIARHFPLKIKPV